MPSPEFKVYSPASDAPPAARPPNAHRYEPNWERTRLVEERLPAIPLDGGYFQGRKMIHHDSPISGGVCVGGVGREAIVVDWRHEGRPEKGASLATLYDAAVQRATVDGRFRKHLALKAVFDTVNEHFTERSSTGVQRVTQAVGGGPDSKVHIDCFISKGTGVCRHTTLTCAAILERMIERDLLAGQVSNDRNSIPGKGAHAWCRYTSSSGAVVILDVVQNFFGNLDESQKRAGWNYARPEDKRKSA